MAARIIAAAASCDTSGLGKTVNVVMQGFVIHRSSVPSKPARTNGLPRGHAEESTLCEPLVLFAYDGSELAALVIEEAANQLPRGRDALVLCVWRPADVGFMPVDAGHFDALSAGDVERAAQATAAYGSKLAEHAGFRARSVTCQMAPTWKGIVNVAVERNASLIVLGSHCRRRMLRHSLASVTATVVAHSTTPVLVVQPQS